MSFLETIKNAAIVGVLGLGAYSLYGCYKKRGSLTLTDVTICIAEGLGSAATGVAKETWKALKTEIKKENKQQIKEWNDPKIPETKKLTKHGPGGMAAYQSYKVGKVMNEKILKSSIGKKTKKFFKKKIRLF